MRPKRFLGGLVVVTLLMCLASIEPSSAGSVSYEYDALGRLERIVYDDGTVIEFTYDAAGNRTSRVVTPGT